MKKVLLFFIGALCFTVLAQAQTRPVKGHVADKSGEPLPGVSIMLKNTTQGTSTDADGNFSINVPASGNPVLTVTYLGYKTIDVTVGSQSSLNITLEESSQMLSEVTVVDIGYGTVRRKDLTGAIASVSSDVIAAAPVSSALEAITGRVSGVQISTT